MKAPPGIVPALWDRLLSEAARRAEGAEPAHDFGHVARVVANARAISRGESFSEEQQGAVATAALLHELFNLPKSHPESARAGDMCAEQARALLEAEGALPPFVETVVSAIRDHAFSKGVVPDAIESKALQDADRLDALGAIGLARMWATTADMKRPFYAPVDPFCESRPPDDKAWGLDHVYKKLLLVPARLHTRTARTLAEERVAFLRTYLEQLRREID